jgi:hypothetical protein
MINGVENVGNKITDELKEEFVKLNMEGLAGAKVFLKAGNWKEYEKGDDFLIKVWECRSCL